MPINNLLFAFCVAAEILLNSQRRSAGLASVFDGGVGLISGDVSRRRLAWLLILAVRLDALSL